MRMLSKTVASAPLVLVEAVPSNPPMYQANRVSADALVTVDAVGPLSNTPFL